MADTVVRETSMWVGVSWWGIFEIATMGTSTHCRMMWTFIIYGANLEWKVVEDAHIIIVATEW